MKRSDMIFTSKKYKMTPEVFVEGQWVNWLPQTVMIIPAKTFRHIRYELQIENLLEENIANSQWLIFAKGKNGHHYMVDLDKVWFCRVSKKTATNGTVKVIGDWQMFQGKD